MKKLIILLLTLFTNLIYGGSIDGIIYDKVTNETLIGATIMIKNTTTGTITNLDGYYKLENLKGELIFVVKYVSYNDYEFTIDVNGDINKNIYLESSSILLNEVVVKSKQIKNTEHSVISMKRKSNKILDGISNKEIKKVNASNAIETIAKITGVNIQDSKYANIRGLGDRYVKSNLNGYDLPSMDPIVNSTQLDIIPSSIIDNIMVTKTYTPDLNGEFGGGSVNITTIEYPEDKFIKLGFKLGYSNMNLNPNFLIYEGGKFDWLGFDDGTRNLPYNVQIPEFYGDQNQNYNELTDITKSFNKIWTYKPTLSGINTDLNFSYGNKKNKIGYVLSFSYKNKYKGFENGIANNYKIIDESSDVLKPKYLYTDNLYLKNVFWNILFNLNYQINNNHKINLNILNNHFGDDYVRSVYGKKPSDDPDLNYITQTLGFKERNMLTTQLTFDHFDRLKWGISYSLTNQNEPDLRFLSYHYFVLPSDTLYEISPQMYPVPTRFYRTLEDNNINGKIDYEQPLTFINEKSNLQVGTSILIKTRKFRDNKIDFKDGNNSFNGNIDDYFSNNNIGNNTHSWKPNFGVYTSNSELDDLTNSYNGRQDIYSSYILGDFYFNNFVISLGSRLETTYILTESLNEKKEKGELESVDILSSLNTTYNLGKSAFKFGYSRTIARPSFRELAPFESFDFVGSDIIVGNPNLERTLIDNLDLRYDYYLGVGEIISTSIFYKNFTNPIEKTFNIEAANPELTWRNVDNAKLYGLEFEFRKKIFNNFKISSNLTLMDSKVKIDKKELISIRSTEPNHPDTRKMTEQSPYIVNTLLSYSNSYLDLETNLSYNVSGKKITIVNIGGTPDIYSMPYHYMTFNIIKKIKKIQLSLEINNILNQSIQEKYIRYNEKDTWKGEEYIYRKRNLGLHFKIGLKYNF